VSKLGFAHHADAFERDGVVLVRSVLDERALNLLERAFEFKLADQGSATQELYPGVLYSLGISVDQPPFEDILRDTPIADLVQGLFRGGDVWYHNEQLWLKRGLGRRTPWHQDAGYERFEGSKIANLWIPLSDLPAENVLETIRGSHRGPLYNPPNYDPRDDTAPTYDDPRYPRMPDIEGNRDAWDIYCAAMQRGDILAFHHATLHGGAPVGREQTRRSFTFRFFGDDARHRSHGRRIGSETGSVEFREENLAVGVQNLVPGEPLHHSPSFRQVRPWTGQVRR